MVNPALVTLFGQLKNGPLTADDVSAVQHDLNKYLREAPLLSVRNVNYKHFIFFSHKPFVL